MYITHDDRNSDVAYGTIIADLPSATKALDYLLIRQKDGRRWFSQVVEPLKYLPAMGGDSLSMTLLHGLKLSQTHKGVRSVACNYVFRVKYLGEIVGGRIQNTGSRPAPGAEVDIPSRAELFGYLGIPEFQADPSNAIGLITNVNDQPLCLSPDLFRVHIGVMGSTGCGKSNVGANLIQQATQNEMCVLVHDVKPDYRRMREANTDKRVAGLWSRFAPLSKAPGGIADVHAIGFYGMCDSGAVDTIIGLHASDFAAEELANLLFSDPKDKLANEGFAAAFDIAQTTQGTFSLDAVLDIVRQMQPDQIHRDTKQSIVRKAPKRKPRWLDALGKSVSAGAGLKTVQHFDLEKFLRPGRVILISYAADISDSNYAIACSYFLRITQNMCAAGRLPAAVKGMEQVVDEAHRLFDNESMHRGLLIRRFNRVMREGRSKDHAVVLLIQNADQIPPGVMQNLGSRIVMRQNNRAMAKITTETFGGDEYAEQTMQLGTGQALVKLFESDYVLKTQMAPSPFELLRSDNRQAATPWTDEELL